MAALILHRRFDQQPQSAVEIDWSNPLARGIVRLYLPQLATSAIYDRDLVSKSLLTADAIDRVAGPRGIAGRFNQSEADALVEIASVIDHGTYDSTLFAVAKTNSAVTSVQRTVLSLSRNGETNPLWRLAASGSTSPTGTLMLQIRSASGTGLVSQTGTTSLSVGSWYALAGRASSAATDVFVNGKKEGSGAAPISPWTPNRFSVGCLFRSVEELPWDGDIALGGVWDRALSDAEIRALSENPWQIFRRSPLRLFVTSAGGLDLSIQSATHAHAADNLTLSATFALSVADAAHAHSADSAAVTAGYALAVNDASHAHAADNVDVVSGAAIVVADSSHAHTAESPAPSIGAGLAVADASHAHTADSAAVTAAYALAVSDSSHAHAADNVVVDTGGSLTIQSATHAHTAEQITLTAALGLAIDSATHGHVSETLTLGAVLALLIDSADHGHTAENLTLDTAITLAIADALHGHLSDGMTLTIGATLAIADALHAHAADGLTLSASLALAVNDALHGHSADNLTMTVSGAGVSLSAEDIAAIAEAVWNHPKALTFQRFIATKDL